MRRMAGCKGDLAIRSVVLKRVLFFDEIEIREITSNVTLFRSGFELPSRLIQFGQAFSSLLRFVYQQHKEAINNTHEILICFQFLR